MEIKRAKKKPVAIEYVMFTGTNGRDIVSWIRENGGDARNGGKWMKIHTLEGDMTARIGHYIIKGIKGEFYPCEPEVFVKSYTLLK